MGRVIPFGNIPDSTIFPDAVYRLCVEKVEEMQTREQEGKSQKLMYKVTSKIVEPKEYKGLLFSEWLVIGTEEDPDAELLETWSTSIGGRALKRFAKATTVPFGDEEDAEAFAAALKGAQYLATIVQKVEEKEGKYKGQVSNKLTAYYKLGEKESGFLNGHAKATSAKAGTKAAAKPAEAKAAPSDEVTCNGCRKRVPRAGLKDHVAQHMAEMQAQGGADDDE